MAASTITRATWTDDSGSGTDGTIINNSRLQSDVYDKIDQLFSGSGSYTTLEVGGIFKTDGLFTPAAGANYGDTTLQRPVLKDYGETKNSASISAGALTLDYSTGQHFSVSLNANITSLTLSNPPASGTAGVLVIAFTADGTLRTITWGSSVKWPSAVTPTMTSTNNKVDIVTLMTYDGGTTWWASINQNY